MCERGTSNIYGNGTISAFTADRSSGGMFLRDMAPNQPVQVMRVWRNNGYPVQFDVELVSTANDLAVPSSLKARTSFATYQAAALSTPYSLAVPITVGNLTVDADVDARLAFDYEVPLAPFTDGQGNATFHVVKSQTLARMQRFNTTLPSSSAGLQATLGGNALTFPGFGHYRVDGVAVTAVVAPTGVTIANCQGVATDGGKVAIRCALAESPLVRFENAKAALPGGTQIALTGTDAIDIGEVEPTDLPITVTLTGTFAAAGTTVLDPTLASKTFATTADVRIASAAEATAKLGIELWPLTITCAEALCLLDRDAGMLPLASTYNWAVPVSAGNIGAVDQNNTVTFVFATAAGTNSFTGKTGVLVGSDFQELVATLATGTYRLDRHGLTAMP